MSSSISVHPAITPCAPRSTRRSQMATYCCLGPRIDHAADQFVVDHVVHDGPIRLVGHQHGERVAVAQPSHVEVALHRVARAEHGNDVHSGDHHGGCSGIGDVQQRHGNRRLDGRREAVHRVRADHDGVGTTIGQVPSGADEQVRGVVPSTGLLQRLDVGEVEGTDEQVRRGRPSDALPDQFVDRAFVFDRRLPRHPTEQPETLHGHQRSDEPRPRGSTVVGCRRSSC